MPCFITRLYFDLSSYPYHLCLVYLKYDYMEEESDILLAPRWLYSYWRIDI